MKRKNIFDYIENKLFTSGAIAGFTMIVIITTIIYIIVMLIKVNTQLQIDVETLKQELEISRTNKYIALPVIITVYNPVPSQTDSTPTITATMNMVTSKTLAISKSLEDILPLGTKILWAGDTICKIDDRMNKRWKEFRIDRCSFHKTKYKEEGLVLVPLKWN